MQKFQDFRGDVEPDHVVLGVEGFEENDGGGDDGGSAGGGHAAEVHVGADVVLVEDVEAREAKGGAGDVDGGDDPEEAGPDVIGEGAGEIIESGDAGGEAGFVEEVADEAEGEEGGGDAEGDHVGEGIEFGAEVGGGMGEAGDEAVEHVEDHGGEDSVAGDGVIGGGRRVR